MLQTTQTNELTPTQTGRQDQNPVLIYLASQKKNAARVQRQALNQIARLMGAPDLSIDTGHRAPEDWTCLNFDWATIRFQHVIMLKTKIGELHLSPATGSRWLCALRGVLKAARLLRLIPAEDYTDAKEIRGFKGTTLPAGRALSWAELVALFAACQADTTPAGARDAALLSVARSAGLRRDEIAKLNLEDYDQANGELKVLHAKGDKQRLAYLEKENGSFWAVAAWLDLRGQDPGPLFYRINKGGRIIAEGLTDQAIYSILKKRCIQAGIAELSPHDFRRTFASDLLDAGADLVTVSKLMGHASTVTTERYDRRGEEAKKKAAGLLHVPYNRQKA